MPPRSEPTSRIEYLADLIPRTWLDPLLTGSDAALKGPGPWSCQDIENLLRAIRKRVWEAEQQMRLMRSEKASEAPCETCNDDPQVCATVPGLRHCEAANRERGDKSELAAKSDFHL